ncbi:MAG: hypothetical protein SNJ75_02430 [Gemmataceae bacterium]
MTAIPAALNTARSDSAAMLAAMIAGPRDGCEFARTDKERSRQYSTAPLFSLGIVGLLTG